MMSDNYASLHKEIKGLFGDNDHQLNKEFNLSEEQKLAHFYQSRECSSLLKALKFHLQMSSLDLDLTASYRHSTIYTTAPPKQKAIQLPTHFHSLTRNLLRPRKWTQRMIKLSLFYLVMKLQLFAILRYQHDRLLSAEVLSVAEKKTQATTTFVLLSSPSSGANVYDNSGVAHNHSSNTLKDSSNLQSIELSDQLTFLRNFLLALGEPFMWILKVPILAYYLASFDIIFLFFAGSRFERKRGKGMRADHLNFILDPLGMRARIRTDLRQIVESTIESLEMDDLTKRSLNCTTETYRQRQSHAFLREYDRNFKQVSGLFSSRLSRHSNFIKYNKLLESIATSDACQPANLSSKWYKRLTKENIKFMRFYFLFNLLFWWSTFIIWILIECYQRAKFRFHCGVGTEEERDPLDIARSSHPLFDPSTRLPSLNLYQRQAATHKSLSLQGAQGDLTGSLLEFDLTAELRQYLSSLGRLLTLAELFLLELFISVAVIPVYYSIFWAGIVDKFQWLYQIERQIDCCIRVFEAARSQQSDYLSDAHWEHQISQQLPRINLITYLNYTLFIRQLQAYKLTANFILSRLIIIIAPLIVLSYVFETSSRDELQSSSASFFSSSSIPLLIIHIWQLIGIGYFCLFVNCHLIVCSLMLTKAKRIMRKINRLVAAGISLSNQDHFSLRHSNDFLIFLWRKQILENHSVRLLFAFRFLGNYIEADKIITFNFYILGLIIIHWRNQSR